MSDPGLERENDEYLEGLERENERLRAWLRAMVDATVKVEKPCGWCVEMQRWAVEALTGTPFDAAVLRDER